jgi:hypothetical protein
MRTRVSVHRAAAGLAALAALVGAAACGPTPVGPSVTVSPATGLTDEQEVTVRGSGYSAGASVGILQCPAGATSPDVCDGRTADSFSTDGSGRYTRTMTVYAVIEDAHGVETDCAAEPGACIVASVYIHGFQGLATADLAFD